MKIVPRNKKGNIKSNLTKKKNYIYKKNISKINKNIYIIEEENFNFQKYLKLKGIKTNKENPKNNFKNNIEKFKNRNDRLNEEKMKKVINERKVNNLKYLNKDNINNKKKSLDTNLFFI